jgi:hypothetical protein
MARKAFLATAAMREQVRSLAARGARQENLAKRIGCDPKTLRKHFRDELDRGMAEANVEIASALFAAAMNGSVAAQIFLAKTRLHWREPQEPEDTNPVTDSKSTAQVVILPDNGRDPGLTEALQKAQEKYFARKKRP